MVRLVVVAVLGLVPPLSAAGHPGPQELAQELNSELAAEREAAAQQAAVHADRAAKAEHLSSFASHMKAGIREVQQEKFEESRRQWDARHARVHSRRQGEPVLAQPVLAQQASESAALPGPAGAAVLEDVRKLHEQAAAEAAHEEKVRKSPLRKLVAEAGAQASAVEQIQDARAASDFKARQRAFDERRKQLLARPNSPTGAGLHKAGPALPQLPKGEAARLAQAESLARELEHKGAIVPKDAREMEEAARFDKQAKQCDMEGMGCWTLYEGCAQDFCVLMTHLKSEECFEKATLAWQRLEASASLTCDSTLHTEPVTHS